MGSKILIVDDETIQASFYELALRSRGYQVQRARDVEVALEAARTWQPNVIILDIMMPPGKRYADREHFSGLRTGVFLISDLLKAVPGVIIVVSTVVKNPETLDMARQLLPEGQITLKAEYDPERLSALIGRLLSRERPK
jgi:CheY-like chemotaxis protein